MLISLYLRKLMSLSLILILYSIYSSTSSAATISMYDLDLKKQALQILKKYSKASAIEFKTQKNEQKKALGISTSIEGLLFYSKGKILYSVLQPNKIDIIYNKDIWIIEHPDLDLDVNANRKVTYLGGHKIIFLKTFSDLFTSSENFLNDEVSLKKENDFLIINLNKSKKIDIKSLKIKLNTKLSVVDSIEIIDDLDNEIIFNFIQTKFLKKINSDKFIFRKLKTDEVLKP